MSRIQILIIILFLTTIGGILRIRGIDKNPVSLNVDEVSVGYNAYSILKTGRDEYGNFLPLSIRSLGDYKPPLYTYLVIPFVAFLGLNEFSIRLPAALAGTLSIPLFYIFSLKLTGSKKYSLIAAILITISPAAIYYSRFALETLLSVDLVVAGMICLLIMRISKNWWWSPLGGLFLALAMYTYQSERLFVPLISAGFIFLNRRLFVGGKKRQLVFFLSALTLFTIPLVFSLFFGHGSTRAQMMFITKDPEFTRQVFTASVRHIQGLPALLSGIFASEWILLLFYWITKFFSYISLNFLFFNGLEMVAKNGYGLGLLYLFELPFVFMGVIALLREKIPNRDLIILWIILGIIPASLTLGDANPRRILIITPLLSLISAVGAVYLFETIKKYFSRVFYLITMGIFGVIIVWNLFYAFIVFTVYFPRLSGEGFMEGTKEAVAYALQNKNKYNEIVFDPVRGTEGPYIVNVPYVYILFYSRYDPAKYQSETKYLDKNTYKFDKFTIRPIDWRLDRYKQGTLFIGSKWSLQEKYNKDEGILQKIYLTNGEIALLIVTP